MAMMRHARVTVEVEVHCEPTNEVEVWTPPSARQVAAFIQRATQHNTDEGWFIGIVMGVDEQPHIGSPTDQPDDAHNRQTWSTIEPSHDTSR